MLNISQTSDDFVHQLYSTMARNVWIILSIATWSICVFLVVQYWGNLLSSENPNVIIWNGLPSNITAQKISIVSTIQTRSDVYSSLGLKTNSSWGLKLSKSKISYTTPDFNSRLNISNGMPVKINRELNSKKRYGKSSAHSKMARNFTYVPRKSSKNLALNISSSSHNFIYMIQTESCLADHLLLPGLFGVGCKSDVLVLTWKESCSSQLSGRFEHMKYIHKENSSWSEGRNILYHFAKRIPKNYLYYIFMDDDLTFDFTNSAFGERYRSLGIRWPLQAFEDFLLRLEPAIGLPMYCSVCFRVNKMTGKPETLCCDPTKDLNPLPDYLPVTIHFDAAFTAFHKNAVDLLLPYRTDYEAQSWWQSQKFLILAADLMFRGQVMRFSPFQVINTVHKKYPKADWDNWDHLYNILKAEIPKMYRDQGDWKPSYSNINVMPIIQNNTVITPMWKMEIPKGKITVEPFKHMKHS